jgi:hypothetical protein
MQVPLLALAGIIFAELALGGTHKDSIHGTPPAQNVRCEEVPVLSVSTRCQRETQ